MSDRVLLTGVSGFLGGHVALQLLNSGYEVRGSVRDLSRSDRVRDTLKRAGADVSRLEIVKLDLDSDEGWTEAARGCSYLQHTASPFVVVMPDDRNELIRPAVEGTRRAINAALEAGVKRIVQTSSMAAVAYGHKGNHKTFTAADWTNLDDEGISAYVESKTRAELLAWELMRGAGRESDLTVINPAGILGPLLDDDPGTSARMIVRLMDGSVPAAPRIGFVIVDVRDVAEAHVAAMTSPGAGGHRYPIGDRPMFLMDAARVLRESHPEYARKLPRFQMPNWLVRIYALFDAEVRSNTSDLGVVHELDSGPVEELLGHPLIPSDEAVRATADSLIRESLV